MRKPGGKVKQSPAADRALPLAGPPQRPNSLSMTPILLENRAVIGVAGADAQDFLQGLITQDVALLAPGLSLFAGLLSPQGKALFDFHLHQGDDAGDGGAILIDVAADRADALMKRLAMYKLRKQVLLTRRDDLAVLASWPQGGPHDPREPALGGRWIGAAGSAPAGADAYDGHRLSVGVPDSADIGADELLWLETGADLLNGVSFTKGCYVGQENTARMHHRDKVRRRLVPVTIAGDPGDGVAVTDGDGRACGTLRSRRGSQAIVHLRLEAAAAPLFLGAARVTVRRPAWLAEAY
jgi:folate-binding protein YgfZ